MTVTRLQHPVNIYTDHTKGSLTETLSDFNQDGRVDYNARITQFSPASCAPSPACRSNSNSFISLIKMLKASAVENARPALVSER